MNKQKQTAQMLSVANELNAQLTAQQPNPPACCYCDREINPLLDEWHWLPSGTRTAHDKCVSYVPTTQQGEG